MLEAAAPSAAAAGSLCGVRRLPALALALLAAACGDAPSTPAADPAALVAGAVSAMEAVSSAHFEMTRSGAPITVEGLIFDRAVGRYAAPAAAEAVLSMHAGDVAVQLGTISMDERTWITDPITGRWHELRLGSGFNPAVLFDPAVGWVALLNDLRGVTVEGQGGDTHHLAGNDPRRPGGSHHRRPGRRPGGGPRHVARRRHPPHRPPRVLHRRRRRPQRLGHRHVRLRRPRPDRSSGGGMTGRRRASPAAILAVVSFGVFVAADDLTVVSTMLRQIIGDLNIPLPDGWDRAAWIVNSYLVAYVAVMPFMGRLSDVLGRRRVFVAALVLFLAGSAWTPFATSLGPFLAARIITAAGGGAMVPVALAAIGDVFEERRRPGALGVLGAVDTIGWVWGPLFGALLVRFLDWRWQFYLNIPLALVAIAAAWWALAGLDRPAARRRIDWPAAASLSSALVCLNIALVNTSEISGVGGLEELTGRRSLPTVPFFVAAAVALRPLPVPRAPLHRPRDRPAPLPPPQFRPGDGHQLPRGDGADHRHGRRPPVREPRRRDRPAAGRRPQRLGAQRPHRRHGPGLLGRRPPDRGRLVPPPGSRRPGSRRRRLRGHGAHLGPRGAPRPDGGVPGRPRASASAW